MTSKAHLDTEGLIAHLESPSTTSHAKAHLDGCASCREHAFELRQILGGFEMARGSAPEADAFDRMWREMKPGALPASLEDAVAQAREWAAATGAEAPSPSEASGRTGFAAAARKVLDTLSDTAAGIVASLVGDSWSDMAVGVRGTGTAASRLLLFEAHGFTIAVSLHPGSDLDDPRCDLEGQVSPGEGQELPVGGTVELRSPEGLLTAEVSDFGTFSFDDTSVEGAVLVLRLGAASFQIGPLPTITGSEE